MSTESDLLPGVSISTSSEDPSSGERRHLVKAATLVMFGNLGSSLMGMVRQIVIASLGSDIAGPFISALSPAQTFNDFLVNGSINGALIPTLNDYAALSQKEDYRRLVFTIINLLILLISVFCMLFLLAAPWWVSVVAPGYQKELHIAGQTVNQAQLVLHFAQIIFFSLLALGPFAVLQAALYARKEFGWPALAPVCSHLGIILGAFVSGWLAHSITGAPYAVAVGVIAGAFGEIALLVPGLRHQRLTYRWVLDLKHPGLRRILKLYWPVALSLLVSAFFQFLDQRWATLTPGDGAANFTAMRLATTLIQFPTGLVATALSIAVLPTLTEHARTGESERFKAALLLGFRLGLLLMIPAAAGLIVLRLPIVMLVFEHGSYTAKNAELTALALQNYAYQLPFLALDQLLLVAFYARKKTLAPVLVGLVCFGAYLAIAGPFRLTIGMPALVLANTVQNALHPLILLVLLRMTIGHIRIREVLPTLGKIGVATVGMVAVAWGLQQGLSHIALFSLASFLGRLFVVSIVGAVATGVYFCGVLLLRVEEIRLLKLLIFTKLGRGKPPVL
jgi:putative peptidoglycan lipid II flippase